ncbi:MAG: DUF3822 family protein [Muribaculaceae bacterium]|nr:DUF3822 family protein [Muribaculaceae bacterium]
MYKLTAADFADTGQWRLFLKIGCAGLEAFLENTLHPEIEPQFLCSASWDINKDNLRKNIEEAVYSNPRLLDDFATRIILYDPRTLFIPSEIVEERLGAEEQIYKKVYTAEETDIMTDFDKDITAAWCLAPGIKSFLMRTFPGARITCNLMEKVRNLRKTNRGISLFVFARKNEADLILLKGSDLISASTHEWRHPDDLAFLALNLLDVYGIKPEDTGITTVNLETDSEAWKYIADKAGNFLKETDKNENNQR